MPKLISNQVSPNLTLRNALSAWGHFICFWKHHEVDFSSHFGTPNYQLYNAARTGLSEIIQHLNLPKDKKIGIPAFTCAVTATPFISAGHDIEWIDSNDQGQMCPIDLKQKIQDIALVLVIHPFGQKVDLLPFKKLKEVHPFILVEDLAHYNPLPVENNFDVVDYKLMSFGREKVYSCISGGAVLWQERKYTLTNNLPSPSPWTTARLLLQPLFLNLALPFWFTGGKQIIGLINKLKILPKAVTKAEKNGQENYARAKLARTLQELIRTQILNKNNYIEHKKNVSADWKQWFEEKYSPKNHPKIKLTIPKNYFRVILKFKHKADKEAFQLKHQPAHWQLSDWDGVPISPIGTNLKAFGYKPGQCPKAEHYAQTHLNLPTNWQVDTDSLR